MSEQTIEPVVQTDASSASTETKPTLTANDDYKRDMFRYKDELKAVKEQLKDIELEKQQRSGNLEGVITSLKDEIKSLKHVNASDKLSYAETQMDSSIEKEAMGRGLEGKKLKAFMRLVDEDDKSIVELDDKFNVNTEDIKSLVDKNMERYGELFKTDVKIVDGAPKNGGDFKPKAVNTDKMSSTEYRQYILDNQDKFK